MMMRGCKKKMLVALLLLLCTIASGNKLRLPVKPGLKANAAEEMLFTEGRKGNSKIKLGKGANGGNQGSATDGQLNSKGTVAVASSSGGSGGKLKEPIYGRPHMIVKESNGNKQNNNKAKGPPTANPSSSGYSVTMPPKMKGFKGASSGNNPTEKVKGVGKRKDAGNIAQKGTSKVTDNGGKVVTEQGDSNAAGNPETSTGGPTSEPTSSSVPVPAPEPAVKAAPPTSSTSRSTTDQVISQFALLFQFGSSSANTGMPTTIDFSELEATVAGYLEQYLQLTYNADNTILFDSADILSTARSTQEPSGNPLIDFEAKITFADNSPTIPSSDDIRSTISDALTGRNLATLLFTLAQNLSAGNPFLATTSVSVYAPDGISTGSGKVASGMSAGSIAAAASAGVATLMVAGYVLFKVKRESSDDLGKFVKGDTGGNTVAGDTLATSTFGAPAAPRDDTQSIGTSVYMETDNHSFTSTIPPNDADGPIPHMSTSRNRETLADPYDEETGMSPAPTGYHRNTVAPPLKSSPLNNADIKNYFKSKYKCGSPRGYSPVAEPSDSAPVPHCEGSKANDLDLPALDHASEDENKPQKLRSFRKNRKYERLGSDDENEYYEEILEDSDEDISVVADLVKASQSNESSAKEKYPVPRLPDERTPSDEITQEEEEDAKETNSEIDNRLDEVPLK